MGHRLGDRAVTSIECDRIVAGPRMENTGECVARAESADSRLGAGTVFL